MFTCFLLPPPRRICRPNRRRSCVGPIANLKGPYFQPSLSVCVCVCVSDRHFYPSTLTDFDETWSQGPYCDLTTQAYTDWLTDGGVRLLSKLTCFTVRRSLWYWFSFSNWQKPLRNRAVTIRGGGVLCVLILEISGKNLTSITRGSKLSTEPTVS